MDPFSKEVIHYNLAVAQELEARRDEFGIDEIQFDYIRFPSDRSLSKADLTFREPRWERYDILEYFLSTAIKKIKLPISIDIYGYNGVYRMGNIIGQDLETISKYLNVICPMYYPSHFGKVFQKKHSKGQTYGILSFSVARSVELSYQDTVIRPYLQAFPYQTKSFDHHYIYDQLKGTSDSGCVGFLFWSPTAKYTKLLDFFGSISSEFPNFNLKVK